MLAESSWSHSTRSPGTSHPLADAGAHILSTQHFAIDHRKSARKSNPADLCIGTPHKLVDHPEEAVKVRADSEPAAAAAVWNSSGHT